MTTRQRNVLTIVVAAYNEADALPMLHARLRPVPVSYTHLTLPTNREV